MITEENIINYFEGKCSAQDAAIVEAWFRENPAKLKEYIGEDEWEGFQPAHALPADVSGRLWGNVKQNASFPAARYSFRWMAAAAAVVLVAGLAWLFISNGHMVSTVGDSAVAATKRIFNNTLQKMMLTLSDGSTVDLSPKSTLSYPEKFGSLKREVVLYGEAEFNIAKDGARPFFVHGNSVLISVLGTRFTVNSFEGNKATKVILHEGRVMVSDSSFHDSKNEFYLTRGDVFISKKVNKASHILHLEKDKDDCYVFNNYPLDVVFDQLQIIYNKKIIYNKAELGNRTFIGKIDKKDSFDHILQSIVLLNNFHLQKQGDSCIVSN